MKSKELIQALEQIGQGYRVDKAVIFEALGQALSAASKKVTGRQQDIRVVVDEAAGEMRLFARRKVVATVTHPDLEISVKDARREKPDAQIGDVLEHEVAWEAFGRIAAQTARQVVLQRMREVERDQTYEQFKGRAGEVVSARVLRFEGEDLIADVGDVEALLPRREQIFKETLRKGDVIKVYILEVRRGGRGPQLVVSRTHPGLLKRLMELEVPEIADGTIEIKAVGREPGYRAKVAVVSKNVQVDAVGTCLGPRGNRLQSVVRELQGEKIDVVEWHDDIKVLVASALSPAQIQKVEVDEVRRRVDVLVSDDQLSLAIGKKGQNARLVSKLTGWKVEIKSETQKAEEHQEAVRRLMTIEGMTDVIADKLVTAGWLSPAMIAETSLDDLAKVEGVSRELAERLKRGAERVLQQIRPPLKTGQDEMATAPPDALGSAVHREEDA